MFDVNEISLIQGSAIIMLKGSFWTRYPKFSNVLTIAESANVGNIDEISKKGFFQKDSREITFKQLKKRLNKLGMPEHVRLYNSDLFLKIGGRESAYTLVDFEHAPHEIKLMFHLFYLIKESTEAEKLSENSLKLMAEMYNILNEINFNFKMNYYDNLTHLANVINNVRCPFSFYTAAIYLTELWLTMLEETFNRVHAVDKNYYFSARPLKSLVY